MPRHYNIPFFIPHEGCPFTCIFCSQKKISGRTKSVNGSDIASTISRYLRTIPPKNSVIQTAFFGGSFTGLPIKIQEGYLKTVMPFIKRGVIDGIRISTRPDYIDQKILNLLKRYHVTNIELGVQSLSPAVLKLANRGHTVSDVENASRFIVKNGFTLAHQIMIGLPGSTLKAELKTARMSVRMKAKEVRIYPVVVIKGTALVRLWKKGLYKPLTEDEAILRSARLIEFFSKNGVKVLRCGLHPSEDLLSGKEILAGPFHQSFAQKVHSYLYGSIIKKFLSRTKDKSRIKYILYNITDGASVIGYNRANAIYAESIIGKRKLFKVSPNVRQGEIMIEYYNGSKKMIGRLAV